MENIDKKRIRLIIAAAVVAVIAVVVISLINIIPKIGKVEVYIGYAPFVAEVKLNDKIVDNNSKTYLEPGDYTVDVYLDGFSSIHEEVVVGKDTDALYGSLTALTDEANEIAKKHLEDYYIVEGYFAGELEKEGQNELEKWPLLSVLPIKNSLYKIGYIEDGDGGMLLTVNSINTYADTAVSKFKEAAKDVDDIAKYKIEFSGFDNPLNNGFVENSQSELADYLKTGYANVEGFEILDSKVSGLYTIVKVKTGIESHYSVVTYLMILGKDNNSWKNYSTPNPILTVYNTPGLPIEVLNEANNL